MDLKDKVSSILYQRLTFATMVKKIAEAIGDEEFPWKKYPEYEPLPGMWIVGIDEFGTEHRNLGYRNGRFESSHRNEKYEWVDEPLKEKIVKWRYLEVENGERV